MPVSDEMKRAFCGIFGYEALVCALWCSSTPSRLQSENDTKNRSPF